MSNMIVNANDEYEYTVVVDLKDKKTYNLKINLPINNFKKITKNIRINYTVFSSNLATISPATPNTTSNMVCSKAGWYSYPDANPRITKYNRNTYFSYEIIPNLKSLNYSILFPTKNKKSTEKYLETQLYAAWDYGDSSANMPFSNNQYIEQGTYLTCRSESGSNELTYYNTWTAQKGWASTNAKVTLNLKGSVSYSSTYTTSKSISKFYPTSGGCFTTDRTWVSRYGTGSPGAPYSYSGQTKIRIQYKETSSSSWQYSSWSSYLTGYSGYWADMHLYAWVTSPEVTPLFTAS